MNALRNLGEYVYYFVRGNKLTANECKEIIDIIDNLKELDGQAEVDELFKFLVLYHRENEIMKSTINQISTIVSPSEVTPSIDSTWSIFSIL